MVNTNYYIENKLSIPNLRSPTNSNKWHQSQNPGRNIQRSQTEFVQRQIKRNSEITMGNKIRQISKECKDMLKGKLEEIRVHNNNMTQKKAMVERHKNYICFKCKLRGHIARNCLTEVNFNKSASPGNTTHKPNIQIEYSDSIHLPTDYMVEGTDELDWNQIWYVSTKVNRHVCSNISLFSKLKEKFAVEKNEEQKKFIFIHGIGEVQIRIGNDILIIPGVHYTPKITLNILSASQMEAQGLELTFKGNRCIPTPMFKNPTDCTFDASKMNQRHNEYLEGYFRMISEGTHNKEEHNKEKADDYIISQNWNGFRENFMKAYQWFYSVYLKRSLPGPLPPKINGTEIHLMDLHKRIETLGGYLGVDFANKFSYIVEIFGLDKKDGQKIKECYNLYLNVFICFYKTARVSHEEAEGLASKGKEICQDGREDLVTRNYALNIQNTKKVEHFGVKLEDTSDSSQDNNNSTYEQGQSSKIKEGIIEGTDNKDDFEVIV
ncbi:ARID DNA-binding domain-containing protein [Artemisia annua]|uniref:ARID DNA-binding domain-containing protein n=1 Tax=Artemisia annua TaxID=35608 RepID=A0A2U1P1K3_ARTAN|nr:ARID DNA-binding domain-containing protein [Artemisia annua]